MNREAQSVVMALMGGLLVAIAATGRFTDYVKPGFAPLLWIGGGILVVVGLWSLAHSVLTAPGSSAGTHPEADGHDDHGHNRDGHDHDDHDHDGHDHGDDGHDHRSRAPWLVLAPVLVLLVAAPPALGAAALAQYSGSQAVSSVDPTSGSGSWIRDDDGTPVMTFDPLPTTTHPEVRFHDFILRALYDAEESVVHNAVTVTGFVAPAGKGHDDGGWSLARVTIACCAADATALRVHVPEATDLPDDTWVRAVITAVPGTGNEDNQWVPEVEVLSLTVVETPADPYE